MRALHAGASTTSAIRFLTASKAAGSMSLCRCLRNVHAHALNQARMGAGLGLDRDFSCVERGRAALIIFVAL
jgi:hypothetical protein